MSTIEEITAIFKGWAAELPPIAGKPTNEDLKCLHELPKNLLQAVKLPGGTDAKGIITTKAEYKAAHTSSTFECRDTLLEAYNPEIPSYATTTDHMQAERKWTAKFLCKSLLQAAERSSCTLIFRVVEDTWARRLETATTY